MTVQNDTTTYNIPPGGTVEIFGCAQISKLSGGNHPDPSHSRLKNKFILVDYFYADPDGPKTRGHNLLDPNADRLRFECSATEEKTPNTFKTWDGAQFSPFHEITLKGNYNQDHIEIGRKTNFDYKNGDDRSRLLVGLGPGNDRIWFKPEVTGGLATFCTGGDDDLVALDEDSRFWGIQIHLDGNLEGFTSFNPGDNPGQDKLFTRGVNIENIIVKGGPGFDQAAHLDYAIEKYHQYDVEELYVTSTDEDVLARVKTSDDMSRNIEDFFKYKIHKKINPQPYWSALLAERSPNLILLTGGDFIAEGTQADGLFHYWINNQEFTYCPNADENLFIVELGNNPNRIGFGLNADLREFEGVHLLLSPLGSEIEIADNVQAGHISIWFHGESQSTPINTLPHPDTSLSMENHIFAGDLEQVDKLTVSGNPDFHNSLNISGSIPTELHVQHLQTVEIDN